MKKLNQNIVILLILVLQFSCRSDDAKQVYHQLFTTTFTDDIVVEGTVEALKSTTLTCPRRLSGTIIYLVEDGTIVQEGDTVCKLENRESINQYENLLSRVENSKAQYEKGKADLEMKYALLRAQVETNVAQTSITNLDSAQLQYLSPQQRKIKELELKISVIEKAKLEKKLEILERINESELRKLNLQIEQDENQAEHIKGIIDQMNMLAPQDGLALRSNSWMSGNKVQEGDDVWGGMPLVEIPDKTKLKVTIQAPESAYKRILEKNRVIYSFNGMPGNTAWGLIEKKAPMGKPIKRNSKVKYFEITASLDSFAILPELGLSANCKIILSEVPDTIVVPQLAIFEEDSIKVVFEKKMNKFIKREVLLGESSPKDAIIIAGLSGDELLTFQKPPKSKVKTTVFLPDSIRNGKKQTVNAIEINQIPGAMPAGIITHSSQTP